MNNYDNIRKITKELFINNNKKLSKLIDKYLIPQELEKKKNAEVSTPYKLRQEMLDKIPNNFWKQKRTVFEPCSGKGGFLVDIIDRFMNGLKEKYPDIKNRYKIIVEKCLYFCDINPTNIFINKLLLDPYNEYNLNYNEGNTLELDIKKKWNIDGFDAVIGNPPYQAPRKKENKSKGGGGDLLWNKFVTKSLHIWIKINGYLCFVHPSGWRKPKGLIKSKSKYSGLYNLMTQNNLMLYLNINNTKEGKKIFNCGTRFDYYVIKKQKPTKKTLIIDEDNIKIKYNLLKLPFIPNKNIEEVMKIISIDINKNIKVLKPGGDPRRNYISNIKTKEFKYTMIHSTPQNGIKYKYCSEQKDSDHFNKSKIIFGDSGISNNIIIDIKGIYGCTCHSIGIQINNNFEKIKKTLTSNKFKEILNSCMWSNYQIDWRLFTYFKKDFWKEFIDDDNIIDV